MMIKKPLLSLTILEEICKWSVWLYRKIKRILLCFPQLFFCSVPSADIQLSCDVNRCEVAQSCLTVCDPMNYSLSRSSIHGIFQARVLEWVAISFSRGSSWTRDRTQVSCTAGRFFTNEPAGKPWLLLTLIKTFLSNVVPVLSQS